MPRDTTIEPQIDDSVAAYAKDLFKGWTKYMIGGSSVALLFGTTFLSKLGYPNVPEWFVASVSVLGLSVASYRSWRKQARLRTADFFGDIVSEAKFILEKWEEWDYRYQLSEFRTYPLAGFDVERWEEEHKELCRIYYHLNFHCVQLHWHFLRLGLDSTRLMRIMNSRDDQRATTGRDLSKALQENIAALKRYERDYSE